LCWSSEHFWWKTPYLLSSILDKVLYYKETF
jgi:hypothetical protein